MIYLSTIYHYVRNKKENIVQNPYTPVYKYKILKKNLMLNLFYTFSIIYSAKFSWYYVFKLYVVPQCTLKYYLYV